MYAYRYKLCNDAVRLLLSRMTAICCTQVIIIAEIGTQPGYCTAPGHCSEKDQFITLLSLDELTGRQLR